MKLAQRIDCSFPRLRGKVGMGGNGHEKFHCHGWQLVMPVGMNIKRSKTQQTGSVILEALIAILIFSMGILALVGMQATAINSVSDSKYRSMASFLANQIVGTVMVTSPSTINASGVQAITPDNGFCTPVACPGGTANAQALTAAWVNSVALALPNTAGVNAPSIGIAGSAVTVTISWQPPKRDSSPGVAPTRHHTVSAFIN